MFSFHYNYRYGIIPCVPVKFRSLSKTSEYYFGIIDTGAPYIFINSILAENIELQRDNNIKDWKSASGVFKSKKAKIDLIIGHAKRQQLFEDIEIYVSEQANNPNLPIIGRYPLFEWYNVNLDNIQNKCHLIPK